MDTRNINWPLAKALALKSIAEYDEKFIAKKSYFHSNSNKIYVTKLKIYLEETHTKKEFIAAMLAISGDFDKNFFGINFHDLTQLRILIADHWIVGVYSSFSSILKCMIENTLTSLVFPKALVDSTMQLSITTSCYAPDISYEAYDKTKAVKNLLNLILTLDFDKNQQLAVLSLAKSLNSRFIAKKPHGLMAKEVGQLWTTAAVAGALFNASMSEIKAQPKSNKQPKVHDRKPSVPVIVPMDVAKKILLKKCLHPLYHLLVNF